MGFHLVNAIRVEHGTKYSGTCVEHGWNMSGTCVEHVSARTHRMVGVLYRRDSEDACAQRGQQTPVQSSQMEKM